MIDLGNARELLAVVEALKECTSAMQTLASAMEAARAASGEASAREAPTPAGWPEFMSTSMAARYCGYRSPSALRNASNRGVIKPPGKRGGVGNCTWARADLDAFLRGEKQADRTDGHRRTARAGPRRHVDRGAAASLEDSIRRIREAVRPKT